MQIVLPGALPDPAVARQLIPYLEKTAPTLVKWLERGRARVQQVDPASAGCTPYEQWRLESLGFQPDPDQALAAGLAALWVEDEVQDDEPIWLAELVHVSPSRDGAVLLPAHDVHIRTEESAALCTSALDLFAGSGFEMLSRGHSRWRVRPPAGFTVRGASPALVAVTSVNDWWPQDDQARPWRRLVNELQMLWFDHPVNIARQQQGLPPINSLWLFGGARRTQFQTLSAAPAQACDDLLQPFLAQDWSAWTEKFSGLESKVFGPLMQQGLMPDLILTGAERIVVVRSDPLARWTGWLPRNRNSWRNWWSTQH